MPDITLAADQFKKAEKAIREAYIALNTGSQHTNSPISYAAIIVDCGGLYKRIQDLAANTDRRAKEEARKAPNNTRGQAISQPWTTRPVPPLKGQRDLLE